MVYSTVYSTVYIVHKRFTQKCVQNAHPSQRCAPQSFCEIELCDNAEIDGILHVDFHAGLYFSPVAALRRR